MPADNDAITESEEKTSPEPPVIVQTDTSYSDGNISISITEHKIADTTVYVADVVLSSPDYLKTAFAHHSYGRNVTAKTSEIAEENGAILAINGDYYGSRERGYVLRNGVIYRGSASKDGEALVIYTNGSLVVTEDDEVGKAMASNPRTAIGIRISRC